MTEIIAARPARLGKSLVSIAAAAMLALVAAGPAAAQVMGPTRLCAETPDLSVARLPDAGGCGSVDVGNPGVAVPYLECHRGDGAVGCCVIHWDGLEKKWYVFTCFTIWWPEP